MILDLVGNGKTDGADPAPSLELLEQREKEHAARKSESLAAGMNVGNQQKWDTFVKERSGGNGGVLGLS